ncbi:MAG: ABC transporter substrate-binding protein [Burkholderiales bacterium]|jgi:phospholipid transport system substrate-binding protein|nr:ABC transporter substrate-binding protein [Burkholderiales bacterium]
MPSVLRSALSILCLILALPALAQGTANASTAPDTLVARISNEVLDALRTDKALQGDPQRIAEMVESKVLPYVDFEKMTRLAVGLGWRQASAEQRQTLVREFRKLLLYTYSGAVTQISDQKVVMKPLRQGSNADDVVVQSEIVASKGAPVALDYRMEKTAAGWKVYDINVAGVWLVESYRNQFGPEVKASGIDGLIKSLSERNARLAAARKA